MNRMVLAQRASDILKSGKFIPGSNYCVIDMMGRVNGCALSLLYMASFDYLPDFKFYSQMMKNRLMYIGFSEEELNSIELVFENERLRTEDRSIVISCILDEIYDDTGIFSQGYDTALQKISSSVSRRKSLLPNKHFEGPFRQSNDRGRETIIQKVQATVQAIARNFQGL